MTFVRHRLAVIGAVLLLAPPPSGTAVEAWRASAPQNPIETGTAASPFLVTSRDGARRYEVRVVRPAQDAPPAGYPVLYLLDGQSTLPAITPAIRDRAWASAPIVFVAIAHDTTDRSALTAARTLDFTVGPRGPQALSSDLPSGGADAFIDLLVDEIRPRVTASVPIDSARQAFYGHSYGALCVLRALFTRPQLFQTYIAASPSLWWGDGYLERAVAQAAPSLGGVHARVLLTIGDQEARAARGRAADPGAAAANVATLQSIARQLDVLPGIDATWQVFEGRNHGAALPPSVEAAVNLISGAR